MFYKKYYKNTTQIGLYHQFQTGVCSIKCLECPSARVPERPSAQVPKCLSSAQVPKCLRGQVPKCFECPSAQVPFECSIASSAQVTFECPSALSSSSVRVP